MAKMEIKIKVDNSQEVLKELRTKMETALLLLGQAGVTNGVFEITALGAVDTGNLRRSIDHSNNGKDEAYIGTNVEYGKYVEFGTSRMIPRPFLRRAVENHVEEYKTIIEKALKG